MASTRHFAGCLALATLAWSSVWTSNARGDQEYEIIPVTRLAMGASFHVHPDEDGLLGYVLDASAGISYLPELEIMGSDSTGLVANVEAGYTLDTEESDLHAFRFTAGVGYGAFLIGGLYQPALIAGTAGDSTAIGMRNGVRGYFFADFASLEVAHQFVHHHDGMHHDIHVLLGVNPVFFAFLD